MWAAEILLRMKEQTMYQDVELCLALPFEGYDAGWDDWHRKRMGFIRKYAAKVLILGEMPSSDNYKKRNYYMVEQAGYMVAVYDNTHNMRSGTQQTVNYAKKKGASMKRYVIRRLLMAIPLLLAISFVCFVFINLIPSNPAEVVLRIQQTPIITDEAIAEMEEALGLNKPFLVRYFDWVLGCLQGDFGISYVNPARTVAGELARCLPATLQLAAASFVIVLLLSIPIGFLCAVYKDGWFDKIMRGLVFISTAMPAYWVGLLLMWGISVKLGLLPTNGNGTWQHMILPAFTVALSYISTYIRLIRNNMLENMKQDYVLYANVRGLPQRSIWVKHVLKNSMHTCIVAMGMSIPQMIAGTIVVENVFSWPGLGTLCISSIFNRDLPVIQTYVLFIGVLFVVFNLVFDILQTVSDPRLRKES